MHADELDAIATASTVEARHRRKGNRAVGLARVPRHATAATHERA